MLNKLKNGLKPAFAYLSQFATDEQKRQVYAFAALAGLEIVQEFFGLGEAFTASCATAPAFAALLRLVELNGIRTVVLDSASRLATDTVTREVGFLALRDRGIEIIAADSPEAFAAPPQEKADIKQVVERVREIDKSVSVALTRGVDKRKRSRTGDPWRKTYAEMEPQATLLAKRLYTNATKKGERITLRQISAELAAAGHLTKEGKSFHPEAIRRMLKGKWPREA